jgi:hypothetical protein
MHDEIATKAFAACLGLGGFVVALVAGLSVDNPTDTILLRAVLALPICAALGYLLGHVGSSTVNRAIHLRADQAREDAQAASAASRSVAAPGQQLDTNPIAARSGGAPGRVAA